MLFFVVMGGVALIGVGIGIAGIIDANQPTYWGTFTEESCVEGGRFGCRSVGTWVSDDGTIRLEDVYLDGKPDSDGTVDARYQPSGVDNDADDNIVHTFTGVALEPLVPWILTALAAGSIFWYGRKWRGTST
ncbi:MAG: hypothetical protein JWP85_45 [Rhodoglobus sp.]|nr:hypothetical protein [Rhodoglobus sp.]